MNPAFEQWCSIKGVGELPASPADVALFVKECAGLGMDVIWPILTDISRDHYILGLADPTLGGPVAAAVCAVEPVKPPLSWGKDMKGRFHALPYDIQKYILQRETERDAALRRAQNELAAKRKKETA